jgi:hypothetical protein
LHRAAFRFLRSPIVFGSFVLFEDDRRAAISSIFALALGHAVKDAHAVLPNNMLDSRDYQPEAYLAVRSATPTPEIETSH